MTATVMPAARRPSRREVAVKAAEGSGTVVRSIRVTPTGQDDSVSTILTAQHQHPPGWIEHIVQQELPARDESNLINLATLVRFARACSTLPENTPRPFVAVGDDATLVAEWDIGHYHLGMQIGNNQDVDSLVFESDKGEIQEVPITGYILAFATVMAEILAH